MHSIKRNTDFYEEIIKLQLNKCSKSPDCKLHIVLNKKKENAMYLCVVVNETNFFFVSTCTCPNNRTQRAVQSHLLPLNPISGLNPQEPTVTFELISSKNVTNIR